MVDKDLRQARNSWQTDLRKTLKACYIQTLSYKQPSLYTHTKRLRFQ